MKIHTAQKNEAGTRRQFVYSYLYKNIINLTLPPGTALSENEIGMKLDVSRTPVREAMMELEKQDLVEILPQIGTYVSLIDPALVEESRFMRTTLEIEVVKLAAREMNAYTLLELERNLGMQRIIMNEGNYEDFITYDDEFHEIIFRSLGKERTWKAIKQMSAQFKRIRIMRLRTTEKSRWEEILKEHEDLYVALKDKDQLAVQKRMKEHLIQGVDHLDELKCNYPTYFKS